MHYLDQRLGLLLLAAANAAAWGPYPLLGQTSPSIASYTPPTAVQRILDYDGEITIQTAQVAATVEARFKVLGMNECSVEIRGFYDGTVPDQDPGGGTLAPGIWSPWDRIAEHTHATTVRIANIASCQNPNQVVLSQVRYWSEVPEDLLLPPEEPPSNSVEIERGRVETSGVGPWAFSFALRPMDTGRGLVIRFNRFLTEDLCLAGRADYMEIAQRMVIDGDYATRESVRFSLDTITECTER